MPPHRAFSSLQNLFRFVNRRNLSMAEPAIHVIERSLRKSLEDLLEHYSGESVIVDLSTYSDAFGWLSERQDGEDQDFQMVTSSVGLVTDEFQASVGLMTKVWTSRALFQFGDVCPVDWTGELTNQLVGRVKNCLSEYDIQAKMSIPVSVRGNSMNFKGSDAEQDVFVVTTAVGRLVCVMNIRIPAALQWTRNEEASVSGEGSMQLF